MAKFFDRGGHSISAKQWLRYQGDSEYRCVAYDSIPSCDCGVATWWLGVKPGYDSAAEPPPLFETAIMGGAYAHLYVQYSTEAAAREGHCRTVINLLAGQRPWFFATGSGGAVKREGLATPALGIDLPRVPQSV